MTDANQDIENRFIKLMLSSTLKTLEALHSDVDVQATVRNHMLGICEGVRARALESAGPELTPEDATAQVDLLTTTINEYFDYAASPIFPGVDLVRR